MEEGAVTSEDPQARASLYGVLVTFSRPDTLRETLQSLARQTQPLDRLLVVDNSPLEANAQSVAEYKGAGFEAWYLPMEENLGPAGGYAIGTQRVLDELAESEPGWVVLVDDDNPPWSRTVLEEMARFAEETVRRDPATGAVGAVGARFDVRRGRADRPSDAELTGPVRIDWIGSGVFPFYAPDALRTVGTFDPRLFFGFEDLELGLRLRKRGYRMYANGPLMLEARDAFGELGSDPRRTWRNAGQAWRRYYTIRNTIWILRQNDSLAAAIWTTLTAGIAKPLLGLLAGHSDRVAFLWLSFRACLDGWTGRLGRRVEPLRGNSLLSETALTPDPNAEAPV
jgi:glycosyltransferase involved in cell wall biosynthesis